MKKFLGSLAIIAGFILLVFGWSGWQKSGNNVLTESTAAPEVVTLTIPEGASLKQIARLAGEAGIAPGGEITALAAAANFADEFLFLSALPAKVSLEGYLFPDTYGLSRRTPARDFLRVLLRNFERRLVVDLASELSATAYSLHQVLTVASLIESEANEPGDRPLVASVIYNRLKLNLPLEIDSTIVYLTGNRTGVFDRGEKMIDSPYNTFRYRGLPPGPISNPGLESLKAALRPAETDYLYFLTDNQGQTHFSETLEEHYKNRAKFLE